MKPSCKATPRAISRWTIWSAMVLAAMLVMVIIFQRASRCLDEGQFRKTHPGTGQWRSRTNKDGNTALTWSSNNSEPDTVASIASEPWFYFYYKIILKSVISYFCSGTKNRDLKLFRYGVIITTQHPINLILTHRFDSSFFDSA